MPALSPLERKENAEQSRATKPAMDSLPGKNGKAETACHARNFLDCVKSRKTDELPRRGRPSLDDGDPAGPHCAVPQAALTWDAREEKVTNDEGANKLLSYEYREPWKLTLAQNRTRINAD